MKSSLMIKKPLLDDEQLFFIHVPKCAGTSFISYIDERYVIDEIIETHYDLQLLRERITDKQLASYRFIRGHLPYDMIIPRLRTKPRIITFLREPVVRLISNFNMRQRVPDPLEGLQETLHSLTLDEFLNRKDLIARFSNRATKLIGGINVSRHGVETPNLALAKERLFQFDFVGIVECYIESLRLFCYLFDFPIIDGDRVLNVSPDRDKRKEIRQSTLERIAEIEWADIELYNYGRELFEQRYKAMTVEIDRGEKYPDPKKVDFVDFDFSLVEPGMGWHVAERHPIHGVIRWSGPQTHSQLRFLIKRERDLILKFDLLQAIAPDILNSLTVTLNNNVIPLEKHKDERTGYINIIGRIPYQAVSAMDTWTSLRFEVNRTVSPKEIDPNSTDARRLGLCYHKLSLTPA